MKLSYSVLIAAIAAGSASAAFAADSLFVDTNTVRKVQQTLTNRGFPAAADGQMGPQTRAALGKFQRSENLEPTGQLNRQTLVALGLQMADPAAVDEPRYSRQTVRTVQRTLNSRGFRAGPADGTMHAQTQQALREFQKSENLDDSGRLNPRTLAALGVREDESASAGASRPARPADASATIREMQRELNARGFNAGTPDGILGAKTRAALRDFQRSANLAITGEPNSRSLDALGISQPVAAAGS